MTNGADCIDDNVLLAFADRRLDPAAASSVNAHLASCGQCRVVLSELARGGAIDDPAQRAPLRRGTQLGRYVLGECLGAGGMGVVYAAEDPTLKRRVAIKLLKEIGLEPDDEPRRQRFELERRILARLNHPAIAQLLDGGTTADGRPWLVLELVEGTPIDQHCDAQKLPIEARLRLFREVCEAVQFAHQNLVVHRDLKPSNILVSAEGRPKLLDFGIARLVGLDTGDARLTATGVRPMTPAFASPEQVRGAPVTTSSDVYALGVILYELLTGLSPYRLEGQQVQELLRAVEDQEPQLSSQALARASPELSLARASSPERLRRELRGDLDSILARALRKEPSERYATVEQFSEDVRRQLEGLPTIARRGSTSYRLSRFVRRHKVAVATTGLALLSLFAGTLATAWQARAATLQAARADARFNDVRKLARTVLFDYHDAIARLPGSTALRERLVKDGLVYLDSLAQESSEDPSLQRELAAAYLKVGDVQGDPTAPSLGNTTGALTSYRRARDIAAALVTSDPTDLESTRLLGASFRKSGFVLVETGDGPEALAAFRSAVRIREPLSSDGDRLELSRDLLALAATLTDQGQLDDALATARRGREVSQRLLGPSATDEMRALDARGQLTVGDVLARRGENAASLVEYSAGVEAYEQLAPSSEKYRDELAGAYQRWGVAMGAAGQPAKAVEALRKTVEIAEARLNADPRDAVARRNLAAMNSTLADALAVTGERAEALNRYRTMLELTRELSINDPHSAQAAADLATSFYLFGKFARESALLAEAEKAQVEGLALAEARLKEAPQDLMARANVADFLIELARVKAEGHRLREALADQERAVALYESVTRDAPKNGEYLAAAAQLSSDLAQTLEGSKQQDKACAAYQRALEQWLALEAQGLISPRDASRPVTAAEAVRACAR